MSAIGQSLNKTAQHYGQIPWPEAQIRSVIGPELGEILAQILNLSTVDEITAAKQVYRSFYQEEMLTSPLFEGIEQALGHFRDMGVQQYVATAKYQLYARQIIEARNLSSFFTGIYGSTESGRYGDKRELLDFLTKEENIKPSQAIMIGDTRFDIEAGRHHRMTTIAVAWGYGAEESINLAAPHFKVEQPQDLPAVVKAATLCGC